MTIIITLLIFCAHATYLQACLTYCSNKVDYVCGTNGITYLNECHLKCATRHVPGLKIAYDGLCGHTECTYLGEKHRINEEFVSKDCKRCTCSSFFITSLKCKPLCPEPITCEGNRQLQVTDKPNDKRSDCICKSYTCVDKKKEEGGDGGCFSATSLVRNELGNTVLIKDVKIGDKVLAVDSTGQPVYSEVIMMLHRNPNAIVDDYIKINMANNKSITLSKYHLIPTTKRSEFIYSKDVKVQQSLKVFDESSNTFEIVTVASIERVSGKGYYAPLTYHGTIVVDDVYASCYASFPFHYFAHWAFSFYRNMYPYLAVSSKQVNAVDELHWYPKMLQYLTNGFNISPNSV